MNKQKRIEELERELKKLKGQRFAKVQYSDRKYILLKSKDGNILVETWFNKKDLNDFDYFERENLGQFWIRGNWQPFEILLNGKWVRCSKYTRVRFLNE